MIYIKEGVSPGCGVEHVVGGIRKCCADGQAGRERVAGPEYLVYGWWDGVRDAGGRSIWVDVKEAVEEAGVGKGDEEGPFVV